MVCGVALVVRERGFLAIIQTRTLVFGFVKGGDP
jgi:hypothetical protein